MNNVIIIDVHNIYFNSNDFSFFTNDVFLMLVDTSFLRPFLPSIAYKDIYL